MSNSVLQNDKVQVLQIIFDVVGQLKGRERKKNFQKELMKIENGRIREEVQEILASYKLVQ